MCRIPYKPQSFYNFIVISVLGSFLSHRVPLFTVYICVTKSISKLIKPSGNEMSDRGRIDITKHDSEVIQGSFSDNYVTHCILRASVTLPPLLSNQQTIC